ncbi:MAG: alpha/beta fold hydrolase [Candidatus Eisenbacteria bacterium]|nr:alpha/beta fold hydrolase [Candidatus Eisenbacteria bacterium]
MNRNGRNDILRDGEAEGTFLLLHGFAGAPESWTTTLPGIGTGAAVRAPALPGHHNGPPAPMSGLPFAHPVDEMSERIGPAPAGGFRLVGYSMGARVALALLLRRPGAFRSALLIGVHPGIGSDGERRERERWEERWATLLEEEGIEAFVNAWERLPLFATQERLPEETRKAQRLVRLRQHPDSLAAAMRALGLSRMPDFRPGLAGVAAPILFVAGDEDPRFVRLGKEAAAIAPRGRFLAVPGCGHNTPLERPDETARLIRSLY